jgi:hypothetical protein
MLAGTRGGVTGAPPLRSVPAWISLASAEKAPVTPVPRNRPARSRAGRTMLQYKL